MTEHDRSILKTSDIVDQALSATATQVRISKQGRDSPQPHPMKAQPATLRGRIDLQSKFRKASNPGHFSFQTSESHVISQMLERQTNSELEMRKTIKQLTESLLSQQKDRDALMSVIKELKTQQTQHIDTDARLKIMQQESEMHALCNKVNTLQQEAAAKDSTIAQLRQQLEDLQYNQSAQNQTTFETEKDYYELYMRYKAVQQMRDADAAQIEALYRVIAQREQQIAQFDALKQQYDAQLNQLFEENKQLNYTIQDLKGKIRIAVRVRPGQTSKMQILYPDFSTYKKTLHLTVSTRGVDGSEKRALNNYTFDRVFRDQETQDSVFSEYMPLVQQVFSGHKVLLTAYGQSGSGKTYTMFGSQQCEGLMPRAIGYIFQQLSVCQANQPSISVQFCEIYNDKVYDLLSSDLRASSIEQQPRECKICIVNNNITIKNLSQIQIQDQNELLDLVQVTLSKRKTSSTVLNDTSSRSHAIFTVNLRYIIDGYEVTGSLTLVDLAGSEQIQNADVDLERKQESIFINKSLSALSNVFIALGSKSQHVNFRDSSLTSILQEYFQGDSKAVMIVCLNEDTQCQAESINSLKFAQRIKSVSLKK